MNTKRGRRTIWRFSALAAILAAAAYRLGAEDLTITTSYPSPTGIYKKFTTTSTTILARDGGNVGIGTAAPAQKLDVNGTINASSITTKGFIMPTGAANNYVLTSNAAGHASWKVAQAPQTCSWYSSSTSGHEVYASCPGGTQMMSGGCDDTGGGNIMGNGPSGTASWHCFTNQDTGVTAFAFCCS